MRAWSARWRRCFARRRLRERRLRATDRTIRGLDAAALLAIDPAGLKGAVLRGGSSGLREQWLDALRERMPAGAPFRRVPSSITEDRLVGGLDFTATIAAGRPVAERGVLAAAHDGMLVLFADRTRRSTWAHVARAFDEGVVVLERDGMAERHEAAFAAVSVEDDDGQPTPASFADRVAFLIDLDLDTSDAELGDTATISREQIAQARARLGETQCDDATLTALVKGAHALGIAAPRTALVALAAARAHAALCGRSIVSREDLSVAARLVLAPRATRSAESVEEQKPAQEMEDESSEPGEQQQQSPPQAAQNSMESPPNADSAEPNADSRANALTDIVIRSAQAALPPGLLAAAAALASRRVESAGRSGDERDALRGRQIGTKRGDPRSGARIDLVASLRAAVPFQQMRRRDAGDGAALRVRLRADDFRIRRCVTHAATTTVFVVDASGSSALNRLAEAKGAVEIMLAEGYARRERVAVIAFRGTTAELVLPPTHALARAKRAIAGLPAGGGTPLAAALDLALLVVSEARRDGSQVSTIILTDGRANVARDGRGGRQRAEADALDAARRLATAGASTVFIDTSPRQERFGRDLAAALAARYLALPTPNAQGLASIAQMTRSAPVAVHG